MSKELTGRKVLLIALGAFGLILGANLTMLFSATGTFPGLVVKNSYVASQGWNARVAAQKALGWKTEITHADAQLAVRITDRTGTPVDGLTLNTVVGRLTTDADDRTVQLSWDGRAYTAPVELGPGLWRVDLQTQGGAAYKISTTLDARGNS